MTLMTATSGVMTAHLNAFRGPECVIMIQIVMMTAMSQMTCANTGGNVVDISTLQMVS